MSIKEIKGNNFPEGNRETKGRQIKPEIKEKPQDIEHVSSEGSNAIRAYGIANVSFRGEEKTYEEKLAEFKTLIDSDPLLSKSQAHVIVCLTREDNIDARTEIYHFIRDRKDEIGYTDYEGVLSCLRNIEKNEVELVKKIISDPNCPKCLINDILRETNEYNIKFAETMASDPEFPKILIDDFLAKANHIGLEKVENFYYKNKDAISKLNKHLNGYFISFNTLPNTDDIEATFEKKVNVQNGENGLSEIISKIKIDKDGDIIQSECRVYNLENGEVLERTTTSDDKYTCDSYYSTYEKDRRVLSKEIRTVYGANRPLYIQKTVASPLMEGVFDTTVYNLAQTDESTDKVLSAINYKDFDAVEQIEKMGIKGWDFARTIENPDGTKSHIEKFQNGEYHTTRKYTTNKDETKTKLDFKIADTLGNKILDIHRTFELKGNKSITTVNGKEYVAEFDDVNMKVKIGKTEIDFKEKMKEEKSENQEILWNLIKKTPGDLILHFTEIDNFKYSEKGGSWNYKENKIKIRSDLGVLAHELGHYKDTTENGLFAVSEINSLIEQSGEKENHRISQDKDLIKIYNEEIKNFKRNVSDAEQQNIKYFSQCSGSNALGLGELLAEVNMLCTTQKAINLQTRSLYLTRYFPKTTAKAAKLLGYGK